MQSFAPWSDVINYLAIDPWVSGILCGPPSHIHQAWSLQPSPSGNASDALSSPQHSALLGYNTDLLFFFFCFFVYMKRLKVEPGGLYYALRYFGISARVRFLILILSE